MTHVELLRASDGELYEASVSSHIYGILDLKGVNLGSPYFVYGVDHWSRGLSFELHDATSPEKRPFEVSVLQLCSL